MGQQQGTAHTSGPAETDDRMARPTQLIMELRIALEVNQSNLLKLEKRLTVVLLPSKPVEAKKALEEPNIKEVASPESPLTSQLRNLGDCISAQSIILTRIVEGLDL